MSQPSQKSERFTAIVSTLVAVAILAAGVTAQQSRYNPDDKIARLQSDLKFQLERAYKHDGNRRHKRLTQVDDVIRAWQQSPQSAQDRQLIIDWLTQATIDSMPGSKQMLPPAPKFGQPAQLKSSQSWIKEVSAPQLLARENTQTIINPFVSDSSDDPDTTSTTSTEDTHIPDVETSQVVPPENNAYTTTNTPTLAEEIPQPTIHSAALQTPTATAPTKATPVKTNDSPVHINLIELAARIDGYHHSLDEVETRLLSHSNPNFESLSQAVQQLGTLTRDYNFIELYYNVLSEKQRRTVTQPRSLTSTLKEVDRHLTRFEQIQNNDFLNSFDSAPNEKLQSLRDQLTDIKSRLAE